MARTRKRFCPGCGKNIFDKLIECRFFVEGVPKLVLFCCPHCRRFVRTDEGIICEL